MTLEIAIIICIALFLCSSFFLFLPKIKKFFSSFHKKADKAKKARVSKTVSQVVVRPKVQAKSEEKEEAKVNPPSVKQEEPILKSSILETQKESAQNLKFEKKPESFSNFFSSKSNKDFKNEFNDIKSFLNINPTVNEDNNKNDDMIKSKTPKDFFFQEDIKFAPFKDEVSFSENESQNEKEFINFKKPNFFDKPNLNYDKDEFLNFEEEIDLNKLSPKMKKLIISDILKRKHIDE